MGTTFVRTNKYSVSVMSTRLITVNTTATLVKALSGSMGVHVTNVGPTTLAWGDASIAQSSGGLLFYAMAKEWYVTAGTWGLYLIADSAAGKAVVTDYR